MEVQKAQNATLATQLETQNSKLSGLEQKLSDPAYMKGLYEQNKPVEEEKAPEFDALEVDDMSPAEVMQEMDRRRKLTAEYTERKFESKFEAQRMAGEQTKQMNSRAAEVDGIRDFVAKTEDFAEYREDVKALYGQPLTIEQSYRFAKLEKIAKEAESGNMNPRNRQMKSDRSAENNTMQKKFESVEDGAKAALEEVLQGFDGDL